MNPNFRGPNPRITERVPMLVPTELRGVPTANPNVPVRQAIPTQAATLRPVDLGSRKPWVNILVTFARAAGRQDTLSVRAPGTGLDLDPRLGVGYYNAQGQEMRGTAAQAGYAQGKRAQMAPLPTPQALLRQVTGIGDPVQGR